MINLQMQKLNPFQTDCQMRLSSRAMLLIVVGLAICLYGAHRLFSLPTEKHEAEKAALATSFSIPPPSTDSRNPKNIKQLEAEIASLRQQVAQLAAITPVKTEASKSEVKNPEEIVFDAKMVENEKKEYQEKMESLEYRFYSEPEDSKWSSGALLAVQKAFSQNEAMRNAARKIECRSSMCRLEIADEQSESVLGAIDSFSQNLTPDLRRLVAHRIDEGEGKATVVLYVSRENNLLVPN